MGIIGRAVKGLVEVLFGQPQKSLLQGTKKPVLGMCQKENIIGLPEMFYFQFSHFKIILLL